MIVDEDADAGLRIAAGRQPLAQAFDNGANVCCWIRYSSFSLDSK